MTVNRYIYVVLQNPPNLEPSASTRANIFTMLSIIVGAYLRPTGWFHISSYAYKSMLSKVKGSKRYQACKMPKVLGTRPYELRQYAINLKKKNVILYYINLKYISFQLRLDR